MNRLRIQDLMTARLCSLFANVHRAKVTDRLFLPADFLLFPMTAAGPGDAPLSRPAVVWDEKKHLEVLERFNKAFGGRDNRPRRVQ